MQLALVYQIVIPVLATVVLSGMEQASAPESDWRVWCVKVGSDLCILATGLAGVFVHPASAPVAHAGLDGAILAITMLISFGAAAGIVALRRGPASGFKGLAAIAIGGSTLGLPIYHIVFMA